jgi:hypothetical protein
MEILKKYTRILLAYIPEVLPQGMTEFNKWADDIIELSGMPKNDSIKFALSAMIVNLGSTIAYKPKMYFVHCLRSAAARQVASQVFHDIKATQTAALRAAAESKEVTTENGVASDGHQQ